MEPTSEYSRKMQLGRSLSMDETVEKAKVVDERTAVLDDGTKLRITPKGQKTVAELVFPDDIIQDKEDEDDENTKYRRERKYKVISVTKFLTYKVPVYSITFVDEDKQPNKYGEYRETDHMWTNECVAQDDRILRLFMANKEETLIVEKHHAKNLQMGLFGTAEKMSTRPIELRHATLEVEEECDYKGIHQYCFGYKCDGCDHHCGGGHCTTDKTKIQEDMDKYMKRLITCSALREKRRRLKVTVKDFRAKKIKQLKVKK